MHPSCTYCATDTTIFLDSRVFAGVSNPKAHFLLASHYKNHFLNSDCIDSEQANNLLLPRAYLPPAQVTPSRWSNVKYIFDFAPAKCKKNDHNDIFPDSLMVYAQFGNLKSIFEKYTYILGGSSYFVYVCGFVNCLCPFFTRVQCVKTDRQLFSEQALYSPGSNRQKGRKDKTFTKIGWKKK